jgi:hypothetical protein
LVGPFPPLVTRANKNKKCRESYDEDGNDLWSDPFLHWLPGQEMQNHCSFAANAFLFSLTLMKTSFQRVPENKKPDDFSSGFAFLAVRTGLEPATHGVTGRYSNQLNYRTKLFFALNWLVF